MLQQLLGFMHYSYCKLDSLLPQQTDWRHLFLRGLRNQIEYGCNFPFLHLKWSELQPELFSNTPFDAVLCLGGSLHHTDEAGVGELFAKVKTVLRPGGLFVVEQRNYEQLFTTRPKLLTHPCGWTYQLDYIEPRTLSFHLMDGARGIDARCECIVTFERELFPVAISEGFRLKEAFFDYGRTEEREKASLIQFIFEAI